eukprot:scaffold19667_cov70-Phaeocystis_antarctica.AAC.2
MAVIIRHAAPNIPVIIAVRILKFPPPVQDAVVPSVKVALEVALTSVALLATLHEVTPLVPAQTAFTTSSTITTFQKICAACSSRKCAGSSSSRSSGAATEISVWRSRVCSTTSPTCTRMRWSDSWRTCLTSLDQLRSRTSNAVCESAID